MFANVWPLLTQGIDDRIVATISLGAPRTYVMSHKNPPPTPDATESKSPVAPTEIDVKADSSNVVYKKRWKLPHGSLVLMQGDTQKFWKHEIVRSASSHPLIKPFFD
jgi:alkylated DNA repair dioxygenase AlkB